MNFNIIQGDNRDTLKTIADNSIDAIITDPPYGIDFLGKSWDANTGALETYAECLRVLKPGGYLLAFSAARTYHHLAITLEQAGFEIRDQIMWIYSSGFPKAQDIGKAIDKRASKAPDTISRNKNNASLFNIHGVECPKCHSKDNNQRLLCKDADCGMVYKAQTPEAKAWAGWKTALKPAHEPICMARKPFKGSTIDNVLAHGVGALNIDATRIALEENGRTSSTPNHIQSNSFDTMNIDQQKKFTWTGDPVGFVPNELGRYPSNVLGEIDGYQKYFYCPKVSRGERHIGFDTTNIPTDPGGIYDIDKGSYIGSKRQQANTVGNNHPTVKPVALMRYLIKLVTPPNSTVLDPFCGSGSTGMAAVELGHEFIGCELDPNYVSIAETRIRAWNTPKHSGTTYEELFE
jgi:DNA modification methylase